MLQYIVLRKYLRLFNWRHISRKDGFCNRVERVVSEELGMTDPIKGNFSEMCEYWGLSISLCLHLKFYIFPRAFFDLLAGSFEGSSAL